MFDDELDEAGIGEFALAHLGANSRIAYGYADAGHTGVTQRRAFRVIGSDQPASLRVVVMLRKQADAVEADDRILSLPAGLGAAGLFGNIEMAADLCRQKPLVVAGWRILSNRVLSR